MLYLTLWELRRVISLREKPHFGFVGVPFIRIITGEEEVRDRTRDTRAGEGKEAGSEVSDVVAVAAVVGAVGGDPVVFRELGEPVHIETNMRDMAAGSDSSILPHSLPFFR